MAQLDRLGSIAAARMIGSGVESYLISPGHLISILQRRLSQFDMQRFLMFPLVL